MTEPLIVSYGRALVRNYPEGEYLLSLERAFKEKHADFIILDDNPRGQKFLAACTAWAIDQGYLYCDREESDGQCEVSTYRLTEKGKDAICSPQESRPAFPV